MDLLKIIMKGETMCLRSLKLSLCSENLYSPIKKLLSVTRQAKNCKHANIVFLLLVFITLILTHETAFTQERPFWPAARIYHCLVYHPESEQILLFCGFPYHGMTVNPFLDSWAYDINTNVWTNLGKVDPGFFDAPAYDVESDRIVVLTTDSGETWVYDYPNKEWYQMNSSSTPGIRYGQTMTYDGESDRIILFGGFNGENLDDPSLDDTWVYDFNSNTWTEMHPQSHPAGRHFHRAVYDSESDRVIVWGGRHHSAAEDEAVWAYDYNTNIWTVLEQTNGPTIRFTYHQMAYHPPTDQTIIYGGLQLESLFTGTMVSSSWSYDFNSNTWNHLQPETYPPKRSHHAMAYHAKGDKILVFGGELKSPYSDIVTNELWLYDPVTNRWQFRAANFEINDVFLNSNFMRKNLDTLTFNIRIPNPISYSLMCEAYVDDMEENRIDSYVLYDDGAHHDLEVEDGIWGNLISPVSEEKEYKISLKIQNLNLEKSCVHEDIVRFTTIGPLVFDHFEITSADTIPHQGDYLTFKLTLRNVGFITTAQNITSSLTALDTAAKVMVQYDPTYGDIAAGAYSTTSGLYRIRFYDVSPDSIYIPFKLDIASNEMVFWSDTFSIYVAPMGIFDGVNVIPRQFSLRQNFPNPFNSTTTIEFDLPKTSDVTLKIFNVVGEEVATLVSDRLISGRYIYHWDASRPSGMASGVYLYRLEAGEFVETKKMVLMK